MGKGKGHIPVRTCVACGIKRQKGNLMRIGLTRDSRVIRDDRGVLPGRGAYVCINQNCLNRAVRKQRFNRAFRTKETLSINLELKDGL